MSTIIIIIAGLLYAKHQHPRDHKWEHTFSEPMTDPNTDGVIEVSSAMTSAVNEVSSEKLRDQCSSWSKTPSSNPPLVKKSQISRNPRNPGFDPILGLSACGGEKFFYILLLKYNDFPLKPLKIRYFFAPAARKKTVFQRFLEGKHIILGFEMRRRRAKK